MPVRPTDTRPTTDGRSALLTAAVATALAMAASAQTRLTGEDLPGQASWTQAIAVGDVDGDGDRDIVTGGGVHYWSGVYLQKNRLFLNDGGGRFVERTATHLPQQVRDTRSVVLADVDGDGDLDLIAGNHSNRIDLHVNDGTGHFQDVSATQMPATSLTTAHLVAGDVDADGDLDLVVSTQAGPLLLLNDGAGTFATAASQLAGSFSAKAAALVDFDGDGDLDLAIADVNDQNRLYVNDGSGTFVDQTAARAPVDPRATASMAVGDVDGDGDQDLLFGNVSLFNGAPTSLWTNDGSGHFTDATATQMPNVLLQDSEGLALGDLDGDGDLDLFVANGVACQFSYYGANCGGEPSRVYRNDGGTFHEATAQFLGAGPSLGRAVVIGDLDQDGDLDLVVGTDGGTDYAGHRIAVADRLFRNLTGQLAAPQPFLIGQSWVLEATMRYGSTTGVDLAVPYLSFARASIPLGAWGELLIDPLGAVPLPLLLIPQPQGTATIQLAVPNVPALVGTGIFVQALMARASGQLHVSNLVPTVYAGNAAATVTSISPAAPQQGATVTVTGNSFASGIAVSVGGVPVSPTAQTATSLSFVMPPVSGCDVPLVLTNPSAMSTTGSLSPTPTILGTTWSGPATGSVPFVVAGENLANATVTIGGNQLQNVFVSTDTLIAGMLPAGAVGAAVVVVDRNGCQTTASFVYY